MVSVSFAQELLDRNLLLTKPELDQLRMYAQLHKPRVGHKLIQVSKRLIQPFSIPYEPVMYNPNVERKCRP